MILRERETGMVIEQAEVGVTNGGHARSVTHWYQVTGVVRDPGATAFAVGQHIAWPYDAGDWEEVGGVKIAWSNVGAPDACMAKRLRVHALRSDDRTLCNIPITGAWYVEDTDQPARVTCVRCMATLNSPASDRVEAI